MREARCKNCQKQFTTHISFRKFCSIKCSKRYAKICYTTRQMVERAANGQFPARYQTRPGHWTAQEEAALRADPFCVLPNRTLRAQWDRCHQLGIPRDRSLVVYQGRSPEAVARRNDALTGRLAPLRRAHDRRMNFRRSVRANPAPILIELRQLASGHQHAEDLVLEGFAIVLRLAIPAAEAFKLAKAEVNRTSAQPFREQSFNPDIDYEARETGRQVARASDIRAAHGDG